MKGINKVVLLGTVTRTPEIGSEDYRARAAFTLVTKRTYSDKLGRKQEELEYHHLVCFGRLAEICGQYLKKERSVYIEGRLRTRQWTDNDGVMKNVTEIIADTIQLLEQGYGGRIRIPEEEARVTARDILDTYDYTKQVALVMDAWYQQTRDGKGFDPVDASDDTHESNCMWCDHAYALYNVGESLVIVHEGVAVRLTFEDLW